MNYVEKELQQRDDGVWAHFYYGLLNKFKGNEKIARRELIRTVELVNDKQDAINHLRVLKKANPLNIEYYETFEEMLKK